jgi:hypothetical protein
LNVIGRNSLGFVRHIYWSLRFNLSGPSASDA